MCSGGELGAGGRALPEGPADPANLRGVHLPGRGPGAGRRPTRAPGPAVSQLNGAPEPAPLRLLGPSRQSPSVRLPSQAWSEVLSLLWPMGWENLQPPVTPGPLDGAACALLRRVPTLPGGGGGLGRCRDPGTSGRSGATGQGGHLSVAVLSEEAEGFGAPVPSSLPSPPRKGTNNMATFRKIWVVSVSSLLQIS